jgi:hypothetical protein
VIKLNFLLSIHCLLKNNILPRGIVITIAAVARKEYPSA